MSVREPGVHVEFSMHPMVHGQKSIEAGHEVTVDKPHVTIRVAGNDKESFFGPVTDQIKKRFPEEWAAFEQGVEAPRVGLLIEHWPRLTHQPSMTRLLKNHAVFTVEDMAACTDEAIQKIGMGGNALRADAQAFLTSARQGADTARMETLEKDNAELKEQIAWLRENMAIRMAQEKQAKKTRKVKAEQE